MNAVITYIFGTNQELLREPLVLEPDTEYICVTDQSNLKSKHWHIIFDNMPAAKCTRDKMPMVKYNPFKYTKAERIIVIDGTLQITGSLQTAFHQLDDIPLLVKPHPERNMLIDELVVWHNIRHLSSDIIDKFIVMSAVDGISLTNKFLIESCVIGYNNWPIIHILCQSVLEYMKFLGNHGTLCKTNQCPFTYLIQKMNVPYSFIDQKLFATRYRHNTWKINNR